MRIKDPLCITVFFGAVLFLSYACADDLSKDVKVSDAWVQAMPPSETNSVAYMTIVNNSPKDIVLVSASSDMVGEIDIHHMSDMNGMMKMDEADNLNIPAKGRIVLQPDGLHMMLINFKKPVRKGDLVAITLHFLGGGSMNVNAPVKSQDDEDGSSMPGMKG